jgi:hypothetical protein
MESRMEGRAVVDDRAFLVEGKGSAPLALRAIRCIVAVLLLLQITAPIAGAQTPVARVRLGWPFNEIGVGPEQWHQTTGSPRHVDHDQFAQDWNFSTNPADDVGRTVRSAVVGDLVKNEDSGGCYGNEVVIRFQRSGLTYYLRYAHLQSLAFPTIRYGIDPIVPITSHSQVVGTVGNSGSGCGTISPHLHIALYNTFPASTTSHAVPFVLIQPHDLAFVIDTTNSMTDDIERVQAEASALITEMKSTVPDLRVAVLEFRDFPVSPYGAPDDFPYRVARPFTEDADAARAAIQALTVANGADSAESRLCALMHVIANDRCDGRGSDESIGPWRQGPNLSNKSIVVLTDAPAHDPEPFTGFTTEQVIAAANGTPIVTPTPTPLTGASTRAAQSVGAAADPPALPIRIYSVVVGRDAAALADSTALAEGTGGKVFTAPTPGDVVEAIRDTLEDITAPALPTTTAQVAPAANEAGWHRSDVVITLTAVSGGGAAIKEIVYSLSGAQTGAATVPGASATAPITAEGTTTLTFHAVDQDGNAELPRTRVIRLDKTPPEATLQFDPAVDDLTLVGRDGLSGVTAGAVTPVLTPRTNAPSPRPVGLPSRVLRPSAVVPDRWRPEDELPVSPSPAAIQSIQARVAASTAEDPRVELRAYTVVDAAGNTLKVAVRTRVVGHVIDARVVSLQYGDAPTQGPPPNALQFIWHGEPGRLESLLQRIRVTGHSGRDVLALFQNGRTMLVSTSPPAVEWRSGLVLLTLRTSGGRLPIDR